MCFYPVQSLLLGFDRVKNRSLNGHISYKRRSQVMEINKKNELTKLKKINIVDPQKNTAETMGHCHCECVCPSGSGYSSTNPFGATHGNIMYAMGG
jgi:hypothetical protein